MTQPVATAPVVASLSAFGDVHRLAALTALAERNPAAPLATQLAGAVGDLLACSSPLANPPCLDRIQEFCAAGVNLPILQVGKHEPQTTLRVLRAAQDMLCAAPVSA